jgi:23S rRNA (adenine2030-N6)-methyltransferase
MNYRHIYHAGNICDVVKHAVLALLVEHLRGKEAAFCVLDTHAGIGLYDLDDPRAAKTAEAQSGILRLLAVRPLPEMAAYDSVLQKLNPDWKTGTPEGFRFYPGSPLLAYHLLRPQDRLVACELHEDDARELRRHFHQHKQAQIHHRDGYEALRAFLPPAEKRGLVLIDPPYENTNEFGHLAQAIAEAYKRWPQGIFMIWYPIKDRPSIWRFHEALIATGIPHQLCAEFIYEEETRADRLNGGGHIIINPPWQMDEKLRSLFPALHKTLETGFRGCEVKWLVD